MTEKAKLLSEVIRVTQSELSPLGFRKRKGIFTCRLENGVNGWLGLNKILNAGDGQVAINPVVGVRHERIEELVERFGGGDASVNAATLSAPLGYVMPQHRYVEWTFAPPPFDFVLEVKRMLKAIEEYGLSFMRSNLTLEAIVKNLENGRFSYNLSIIYRLPVAYLVAGQRDRALEYVHQRILEFEAQSQTDTTAQQYKTFATNFSKENAPFQG